VGQQDRATSVLEDLVGYYNEQRRHQETEEIPAARWDGALQRGQGRLRQMPEIVDLALLFTVQYERLVHSDGKVRFLGRTWPVSAPAGSRVTVCWRPQNALVILWNDRKVGAYAL